VPVSSSFFWLLSAKTRSTGEISSSSQCYTASPYLVDFEVGRSFQEPQVAVRVWTSWKFAAELMKPCSQFADHTCAMRDSVACRIPTRTARRIAHR
jgi:hypothetical protein